MKNKRTGSGSRRGPVAQKRKSTKGPKARESKANVAHFDRTRGKAADTLRSTEEVFYDHLEKRKKGLVEDDIAQNYSPDVVQLTCTGIYRGHDGVRERHRMLKKALPKGEFESYNTLVDGEMAFLEWRGFSDHHA